LTPRIADSLRSFLKYCLAYSRAERPDQLSAAWIAESAQTSLRLNNVSDVNNGRSAKFAAR